MRQAFELKRQGGWQRWEQVERYSHAVPPQNRRTLPNPFDPQNPPWVSCPPRGSAAFSSRR